MSTATLPQTNGHAPAPGTAAGAADQSPYRWIALTTVTLGTLMVFINQSIVLISLPDIFRGINLNPLTPGNTGYMLWMLMGFMVVLAVLVVTLGRVGDMFGRVKIFNLGFAVFTVFSILLAVTWLIGRGGGHLAHRHACRARSRRRHALRQLLGDHHGRLPSPTSAASASVSTTSPPSRAPSSASSSAACWRRSSGTSSSSISVPFGVIGTMWAYVKLEDRGVRTPAKIDWLGNVTFAVGLVLVLVGITYGLLPYGGHTMGWTSPVVMAEIFGGIAILIAFGIIETKVSHPMFRLSLFRIRAFSAGNVASFLASLSRGGLMFMLVIWLQGIWLPLHGYSFEQTPLWAGIYMIPLTVGLLLAGPVSGVLADRYGARPFATGGLVLVALTFIALILLPVDFPYLGFAVLIFFNSIGMGMFIAPNQTGIMNSLPASQRGAGAGMAGTFNSSAQVLSIGIFFTLMILGLAATLPSALFHGLTAQGVSRVGGDPRLAPAPGRQPLRGLPRVQPDTDAARSPRALAPLTSHGALPHQPRVLPAPDRPGLLPGPDRGLLFCSGGLPARRRGVPPTRRQVPPRGRAARVRRNRRGGREWSHPHPRPRRRLGAGTRSGGRDRALAGGMTCQ